MKTKLKLLIAYNSLSIFIALWLLFNAFSTKEKKLNLDEIAVKRINVIPEDGKLRMVLSNENRQHPGRLNGKDLPKRERGAGLLFFNTEGDECGGLLYSGDNKNNSGHSVVSLTMDQYHEDQVMQILNSEQYENGKASIERGIVINDYPIGSNLENRMEKYHSIMKINNTKERNTALRIFAEKESAKNRLFIGRSGDNSSGVFISGPDGKPKILIYVDAEGKPKFEVIDNEGKSKNILEAN